MEKPKKNIVYKANTLHHRTTVKPASDTKVVIPENDTLTFFRNHFERISLPYSLSQKQIEEHISHTISIDTFLVGKYIENPILTQNTISLYRYYPIGLLEMKDGKFGVIVLKTGAAGGHEDYYYLLTYLPNQKQIDKFLIGQYSADCSFKRIISSNIDTSLQIHTLQQHYSINCEMEETKLTASHAETLSLKIFTEK